jgi:NAD(P)-dependent dehydrogenase (short-subunit alcohol dehydrogenase family)
VRGNVRQAMGTLLTGKGAVVTGAASGIGLATARRFMDEGARVVVLDLDEQLGKQAAEALEGAFVRCDVTDSASVAGAFGEAERHLERLDVAHLNAGVVSRTNRIEELTDEEYRRVTGVNIDGVVFGIREAAKVMKRTGGGAIVATASLAGLVAYATDPLYALTKHAVVGLVRGLAPLLVQDGITVNCVCPGITDTPMIASAREGLVQSGFPLITPEEIAEGVVRAIAFGGTGEAWVCQAGREPLSYEFRGVPGPRVPGKEGMAPPDVWR